MPLTMDEFIEEANRVAAKVGLISGLAKEEFRKSVNGVYTGKGTKMVKAAKNTTDPAAYRKWLQEESQRQRDWAIAKHTGTQPVITEPDKPELPEVKFKKYGDLMVDISQISYLKTEDKAGVAITFTNGQSVVVDKKYENKLYTDLNYKEE